jgi:2,5-dihydroxypyridine 5,6-dioxygenase
MLSDIKKDSILNLLFNCGQITHEDQALVLCDEKTKPIADAFTQIASAANIKLNLLEIPELSNHGAEPPSYAADSMEAATLIISLCGYSLAHSKARVRAAKAGARFLSLPLYNWELLEDPSLRIDFKLHASLVRAFADAFSKGEAVRVTTDAGTNIEFNIKDRVGNYCPGFVENPGDLGSPPDIEANVSPIENSANGIVIVDGSITHPDFGLLVSPVKLIVEHGKIIKFESKNQKQATMLDDLFGPIDSPRRVLAECGVGLNPAAKLTGIMLTDEGALGYLHFGFGANHTVGGLNEVDFHLDFVFRAATLTVDSKVIISSGVPQL